MFYWEKLTRDANKAHSNNDFLDAIELNEQALSLLSFNYDFNKDVASTVEESIVNFLNMAESYSALGDYVSANEQYENAEKFLQSTLSSKSMNSDEWHFIMKVHNQVRFEWNAFKAIYKKAVMAQKKQTWIEVTPNSWTSNIGGSFYVR